MKKTQFAKQATRIQQIFLAHVSWALRSECGWPPLVTGHFVDQALSKIIFTILLWGEAERTIRSCNQNVWQWLETSWNIRIVITKLNYDSLSFATTPERKGMLIHVQSHTIDRKAAVGLARNALFNLKRLNLFQSRTRRTPTMVVLHIFSGSWFQS